MNHTSQTCTQGVGNFYPLFSTIRQIQSHYIFSPDNYIIHQMVWESVYS